MIIWKSDIEIPNREPDYTIVVKKVPPTGNSLLHADWKSYIGRVKKWTACRKQGDKVDGLIAKAFLEKYGSYPQRTIKNALGRITFYWPYERDRANWAFVGLKWCEDALQYIGLITTDKPQYWHCQIEYEKCSRSDIKTVIDIWDMDKKTKHKKHVSNT